MTKWSTGMNNWWGVNEILSSTEEAELKRFLSERPKLFNKLLEIVETKIWVAILKEKITLEEWKGWLLFLNEFRKLFK